MPQRYFNCHTHFKPSKDEFVCRNAYHRQLEKLLEYGNYPVSIGVHPWYADQFSEELMEKMHRLSALGRVLAIGETGLDKRRGPELEVQLRNWVAHAALASQTGLPLMVHCVRAWQEIRPACMTAQINILFHDFRGNHPILNGFLPYPHLYFSFGKSLFQSEAAASVFRAVPENRFLLETDHSTFSIHQIYEKAAQLRQMKTGDFSELVKKNSKEFFGAKALPFF